MKKILVLGSTGSIGVNTIEIVRSFPEKFEIIGLTANNNIELLRKQIEEFHPKVVVVRDAEKANELKSQIGNRCEILTGDEGLIEIEMADNPVVDVLNLKNFTKYNEY